MYYLPIIINNRKTHICQLGMDEQKFVPKFIVKADTGKVPLIRIQHQAKIFADSGISEDLYLEGRWNPHPEDFNNDTGHYNAYVLEFRHRAKQSKLTRGALKSLANKKKPFVIEEPVKDAGNLQDLVLSWEGKTVKGHNFPVTIRLKTKEKTYEYKMEFHVAEPEHIYNAVFDFGSAASQMAYLSKDENAIERVELLYLMDQHFYSQLEEKKKYKQKELYQFDADDDTLYVSNFMVKKDNGKSILNPLSIPFENDKESILHLMMTRMDYQQKQGETFERIPNLKLSEFKNFKNFKITLQGRNLKFSRVKEELFHAILNQFFILLVKSLTDESWFASRKYKNWENVPKKIIITLLVPNIYDQRKVTSLIEKAQYNFNKLCKSITTHPSFSDDLKINAVEVQTISESDASFLGFTLGKLRRNLKLNSNYMVIDGGKGTLDISVIKVEEDALNYNGIYRGGIAGAGNVLTYAFLENIAALAVGIDENKRRAFIKNFLNTWVDWQIPIIEYVEILKKRYSTFQPVSEADALDIKLNGDLLHSPRFWIEDSDNRTFGEELMKILKEKVIKKGINFGDYYGIIKKTIDGLVKKTLQIISGLDEYSLNNNRFGEYKQKLELEYVILSGRSFLLKPFRESLIQALVDNAIVADRNNIIWDENLAKKSCVEGPLLASRRINRNANLVGFPIPESVVANSRKINGKKTTNQLETFLGKYFQSSNTVIKENGILLSEKFFLEGLPIKYGDVIRVGDVNYDVVQGQNLIQIKGKKEKTDVIFTGTAFKVRSLQSSAELEPIREQKGLDDFLWKSLFPHVKEADEEEEDSSKIPITTI